MKAGIAKCKRDIAKTHLFIGWSSSFVQRPVGRRLRFWTLRRLGGARAERSHQNNRPRDNSQVSYIENTGMKRAHADQNKICDQTMTRKTIYQVTHASRPNQHQAQKGKPGKSSGAKQINQQKNKTEPDTSGKKPASDCLGQRCSETKKRAWVFRQNQFNETARQRSRLKVVELGAGKVFCHLVAARCG